MDIILYKTCSNVISLSDWQCHDMSIMAGAYDMANPFKLVWSQQILAHLFPCHGVTGPCKDWNKTYLILHVIWKVTHPNNNNTRIAGEFQTSKWKEPLGAYICIKFLFWFRNNDQCHCEIDGHFVENLNGRSTNVKFREWHNMGLKNRFVCFEDSSID